MTGKPLLRIGTRASPLALAQTRQVQAMIAAAAGVDAERLVLVPMTTRGDQITDRLLLDAGGKGLFTKELDAALLDGRIDLAVHSMKDLPVRFEPGLALAAVPAREDPRDAFVSVDHRQFSDLPHGAVLGTASLRRRAQALFLRPDLAVQSLRGNVETRLARVREGRFAATFLAAAGLNRLGLSAAVQSYIALEDMPPAPGQGALALVARADDGTTRALAAAVHVPQDGLCVAAERAFLDALDGSCRTPIAAHARITQGQLFLTGEALAPSGRQRWREQGSAGLSDDAQSHAEALGRRLGLAIKAAAGDAIAIDPMERW